MSEILNLSEDTELLILLLYSNANKPVYFSHVTALKKVTFFIN